MISLDVITARRHARARVAMAVLCFLGLGAITRVSAAQSVAPPLPATLTLSVNDESAENRIAERALREAYRRLGVGITLERVVGDSGIIRANAGALDGDVAHLDGSERTWGNLVQVAIPLGFLDVAVFVRDPASRIRSWDDLATVRVGLVRGASAAAKSAAALRVRVVETPAELFALFASGELDAIVVQTMSVARLQQATPELRAAPVVAVLDTYLLYHYLHQRHAAVRSQVEPILRTMLLDGSIARIRETVVAELAGSLP